MKHYARIILAWVFLVFLFTQQAHAYFDPGAGSFVLQMLVAALLGGTFALKTYWFRLKGAFHKRFGSKAKKRDSNKVDTPD